MQSVYGVELEEEDEISPSTLNRLWVLYNQLPTLNRISRAAVEIEPQVEIWDENTKTLADLVDAVNYNTFVTAQSQSRQRIKPPKPYPRPDYLKKYRSKQDKTPKRNRLPGTVRYVPKVEPKED